MAPSSWELSFAERLLAQALFYDVEYGVSGNLSLVDTRKERERYISSYLSEEGQYIIERGTQWSEDKDVGFALAVEAETHKMYDTAKAAAAELLKLARRHRLVPSIALLFEEDASG